MLHQPMTALSDAVVNNSLTRCYYLHITCFACGELRAAVSEIPTTRFFACPRCQGEAEYRIMGQGGTLKALPFWERLISDQYAAFWKAVQG